LFLSEVENGSFFDDPAGGQMKLPPPARRLGHVEHALDGQKIGQSEQAADQPPL